MECSPSSDKAVLLRGQAPGQQPIPQLYSDLWDEKVWW